MNDKVKRLRDTVKEILYGKKTNKVSDFKYIKNISDGVATMYIYDQIGSYYDESIGEIVCTISGIDFAREMEYLQDNCKEIQVKINSIGGSVLDGYSIYEAIRTCKVPVTTINTGLAASIASIIFLAGHKRLMYDYASLMIHNPSMSNNEESHILDIVKEQLLTIIKNNTLLSKEDLDDLMNSETFFDSSTSLENGFIDEIISTNRKVDVKELDLTEMMNVYNKLNTDMKIENKEETKIEEVTNKVDTKAEEEKETGLEEANETEEEQTEEAEEGVEDCKDEMTLEEAKKLINDLTEKLSKLEEEKESQKVEKVKNMLGSFEKSNIINKSEIDGLTKLALIDYDSVFNMLNKVNTSKSVKAVKIFNNINKPTVYTGRETWTIRDWEKKDSKGLLDIKNNTPELYEEMFNSYYKK